MLNLKLNKNVNSTAINYGKLLQWVLTLPILALAITGFSIKNLAQDVNSNWIKVGGMKDENPKLSKGKGYLTIQIKSIVLFSKSATVESLMKEGKLLCFYTTEGTIGGIPISDGRMSPPVDLKAEWKAIFSGKGNQFTMSWHPNIVTQMPIDFEKLEVAVKITRTAKNATDDVLNIAQKASSLIPDPATNLATNTALAGGKAIADYFIEKELVRTFINTHDTFQINKEYGLYVIFAASKAADYKKYEIDDTNLSWNGSTLFHADSKGVKNPINDVSYIVIEASASEKFDDTNKDEKFWLQRVAIQSDNWALKLQSAIDMADSSIGATDAGVKGERAKALLTEGRTLLNSDKSICTFDRDQIFTAVKNKIDTTLKPKATE